MIDEAIEIAQRIADMQGWQRRTFGLPQGPNAPVAVWTDRSNWDRWALTVREDGELWLAFEDGPMVGLQARIVAR